MRGWFIAVAIISLFFVLLSLIYFPFVYLNFTFTFDFLLVTDIPFYDSALGSNQSKRYYLIWWEYATDILRIVEPPMMLFAICTQSMYGPHSNIGYIIFQAIMVILETVKVIKRGLDWVYCHDVQVCRNYDPDLPAGKPNMIFLGAFAMTFMFWIMSIAYALILPQIGKAERKKLLDEKEKASKTSGVKLLINNNAGYKQTPDSFKRPKGSSKRERENWAAI
jgi:hypothetical protein